MVPKDIESSKSLAKTAKIRERCLNRRGEGGIFAEVIGTKGEEKSLNLKVVPISNKLQRYHNRGMVNGEYQR